MEGSPTEIFDKVSAIVIEAFNTQAIPYGPRAKHSYPVKWDEVFSEPVSGGGQQATDECRGLLAYILANHIPLFDPMRDDDRLVSNMFLARYFLRPGRYSANSLIGTGCRLIVRDEYRSAYNRALIGIRAAGVKVWNVDKPERFGNCDQ